MAKALEILPLTIVPHFLINKTILHPLRKQTGGTVLVSYVCTIHMSIRTSYVYTYHVHINILVLQHRLENWPRTEDGPLTLVVVSIIAVAIWEAVFVSMQISVFVLR